jgi:hypothetical protein
MRLSVSVGLAVVVVLGTRLASGAESEARPAITARLVHPDEQCARLLTLFEGARVPNPAAALAAWKRATGGRESLGKPSEAFIALWNPDMVREWRTVHGSELVVRYDAADGHLRWSATVPRDDGTLAALATALALTDGAREEPLGDVPIDRLGPPGSPVMAVVGKTVVAAGARDELPTALTRTPAAAESWPAIDSGILFQLVPDSFGSLGPVARRRLAEGLRAAGCSQVVGTAALEGEQLHVALTGTFDANAPGGGRALEPAWLDVIPESPRVAAAFAMAIDPEPAAWNSAFSMFDRIERADPARAGVAPFRTRLNLLTLTSGARLEAEFWPRLVGISGALFSSQTGGIEGGLLALHTTGTDAATRIAHHILPALATAFRLKRAEERFDVGEGVAPVIVQLGNYDGRALATAARGATVLVSWGDVSPVRLGAEADPIRSAGTEIRSGWGDRPPQRAGAIWPGRLAWPRLAPPGSPLAEALHASPPLLWQGRDDAQITSDEIRWPSLRLAIRRFLERLPLDPPPNSP